MFIWIAIIILLVLFVWMTYNSLITAKVRMGEAFSQIDVQLKRRSDLIPNLVETVKGYAKHEKQLLEAVTKARTDLMSAKGVQAKAKANNQLAETLKSIFAVAENYPNLKANENFLSLQEELSDTENKIAYARQFYNSTVMDYNTKLSVFPTMLFANMLQFKAAEFFAATEDEKKPVQVKF
ncbi:MAG: LemA family protein [Patescibacteria group bacterium]|nr:LemA family protein [Patescibacteria group bacterium]MDE2590364.1 LemA family protein [Patescibacteria group bacterium]